MAGDGCPCRRGLARAPCRWARADRRGARPRWRRRLAAGNPLRAARGAQRPRALGEAGMILCIDAGNSRVKWGWHDGQHWTSIATVSLIEFAASSDHINPFSVAHEAPERNVISNVAGDAADRLQVNYATIYDSAAATTADQARAAGA